MVRVFVIALHGASYNTLVSFRIASRPGHQVMSGACAQVMSRHLAGPLPALCSSGPGHGPPVSPKELINNADPGPSDLETPEV